MSVFALGLNHTTAPLDVRGRFAFAPGQLPAALQSLQATAGACSAGGCVALDLQPH